MSFVTALVVFASIQVPLVLALWKLNRGPRISGKDKMLTGYLNKTVVLLFATYILLAAYCAATGTISLYWIISHALLMGVLVSATLVNTLRSSIVLAIVVAIPVVFLLISLVIHGAFPSGQDEGRFSGFAYRVKIDGRWQPFVYLENAYYQFFHVAPCFTAILSVVTGSDVLTFVYPLIRLIIILAISLNIYVVVKNLVGIPESKVGVLGLILLLSTPPIAAWAFIPQTLAVVFYLLALALISFRMSSFAFSKFVAVFLISAIGVVTHAAYPILLLSSLLPIYLVLHRGKQSVQATRFLRFIIYVVIILTLSYWTYTLTLNQIVKTSVSWIQNMVEVLTGQILPFSTGRPVWYSATPFQLAYPWVLLISLATVYVLSRILDGPIKLKIADRIFERLRHDLLAALSITGILLLGTALVLRASFSGWGVRYFYPFFILLIPASAAILSRIGDKRRIINTVIIIVMLAIGSFYAIQDPMMTGFGSEDIFLLPDRKTWNIAGSLMLGISLNTDHRFDPRVNIPFTALIIKSAPSLYYLTQNQSYTGALIIVNQDHLGKQWADGNLEETVLQKIEENAYTLVYTDGSYKGYYITQEFP